VAEALAWFCERAGALGYAGGLERNVLLPTAVGALRPTAVVPASMAAGDLSGGGRVLIAGFRSLKDFHPRYAASNLAGAEAAAGARVAARGEELATSPQPGRADVPPMDYARGLDDPALRAELGAELRRLVAPGEAVGLPAVIGTGPSLAAWEELQERAGAPLFEIPTLPPSVPGIRLFGMLSGAIRRAGGRIVIGGRAIGVERAGRRVEAVVVETAARPVAHASSAVVLATGGFASGGLDLDSHGAVRETVLGLPVAHAPADGAARFGPGVLDAHPLGRAGIATDALLRPLGEGGEPVYDNVHVAGAQLAGAEPWREKSGDGITIATGYRAAGAVLEAAA
jgi:glycerol-3-phosphate dehydrogenase subunit B